MEPVVEVATATTVVSEEKRLGEVVQLARRHAGLTQQALCQKSGLSYSTLAKIERGAIKSPSIFTIQQIAATLGVGLDQLMQHVPASPSLPAQTQKKVSKTGIRFVFFDMNGCLVRAAVTSAADKLAQDSGVTRDVIESIYWRYDSAVCRGDVGMDEFNTALAKRLGIMVDWNKYYLSSVEQTPGIDDLITWAAQNYRIGILTNTMPGLVTPMLETHMLPHASYDTIIESSAVHIAKPEAAIFELAADRVGLPPSQIMLVDDDPINLSAAGRLGWHTMSFDAYQPEASIVAVSTALQPSDED